MKLFKLRINEKIVAIIAVVLFVGICLLPLLLIGKYNHPCADDYGYGYEAHVAWRSTHSLIEAIKAAANTAKNTYYTWQGTFVSIFLMGLTPAVFGEEYYCIVPYIMLGILSLSILYLSKVLVKDVLKGTMANSIIISVILLLMIIQGIYTPASAFFWYNAAVHYTFMQAVMFFMIALAIKTVNTEQIVVRSCICLLSALCAFIVSGGNYLNALIGIVLLVSLICTLFVCYIWCKKKQGVKNIYGRTYFLLFPLVVYIVGFAINVIAPGNEVRGSYFVDTPAIIAILRSFGSGFQYCIEWMSLFTFVLLILALPAAWKITDNTKFRFRMPWLVILFSFCLFSASFTSSHYGLGEAGLPRTFNNCKMLYHLLLMINEVYLIGWLKIKLKASKKEMLNRITISHWLVFYLVVSIMLCGVFLSCDNKQAYYPSYASAKYMHQGFALYYHIQYQERIVLLNGPEQEVYLREISPKLNILYVDDITANPSDWRNMQYAAWYGKEKVILVPWDEWNQS